MLTKQNLLIYCQITFVYRTNTEAASVPAVITDTVTHVINCVTRFCGAGRYAPR